MSRYKLHLTNEQKRGIIEDNGLGSGFSEFEDGELQQLLAEVELEDGEGKRCEDPVSKD